MCVCVCVCVASSSRGLLEQVLVLGREAQRVWPCHVVGGEDCVCLHVYESLYGGGGSVDPCVAWIWLHLFTSC